MKAEVADIDFLLQIACIGAGYVGYALPLHKILS